jgi:hypothetical protein
MLLMKISAVVGASLLIGMVSFAAVATGDSPEICCECCDDGSCLVNGTCDCEDGADGCCDQCPPNCCEDGSCPIGCCSNANESQAGSTADKETCCQSRAGSCDTDAGKAGCCESAEGKDCCDN